MVCFVLKLLASRVSHLRHLRLIKLLSLALFMKISKGGLAGPIVEDFLCAAIGLEGLLAHSF